MELPARGVLYRPFVDAHRRLKFEWLVKERGDLDHASLDAALPGERRLLTAHAVYRLLDGICVEVDDLGMTGHARSLIGMELVGWIPLRADAMLDDWEPGARAVFWRRGHDDQLAMTSSVMDVKAVGVPKARESDVREMRIGPVRPDVSFTPATAPQAADLHHAGGRATARAVRRGAHEQRRSLRRSTGGHRPVALLPLDRRKGY